MYLIHLHQTQGHLEFLWYYLVMTLCPQGLHFTRRSIIYFPVGLCEKSKILSSVTFWLICARQPSAAVTTTSGSQFNERQSLFWFIFLGFGTMAGHLYCSWVCGEAIRQGKEHRTWTRKMKRSGSQRPFQESQDESQAPWDTPYKLE